MKTFGDIKIGDMIYSAYYCDYNTIIMPIVSILEVKKILEVQETICLELSNGLFIRADGKGPSYTTAYSGMYTSDFDLFTKRYKELIDKLLNKSKAITKPRFKNNNIKKVRRIHNQVKKALLLGETLTISTSIDFKYMRKKK